MKQCLTIAGFDPSGGAGIQADLMTFAALGVNGLSIAAALTAQDGVRVSATMPVPPAFVRKQAQALFGTCRVDAVKIGMLATAGVARAVAGIVAENPVKHVVLDPVMASSSGTELLDEDGKDEIYGLLPYCTVVTPNLSEASILCGFKVDDIDSMAQACRAIRVMGPSSVLVKGGHLDGAPVDVLFDGRRTTLLKGSRIRGSARRLHGTGCILSSAIAAHLSKGMSMVDATRASKRFLERTISIR